MKKFILIIFVISNLYCQNTNYGDAFMNIGASSRSIGLGRAVVALPQHTGGFLVNPAATGFVTKQSFSVLYVNQFELAEYVSLGYSRSTKSGFQWGVHGISLFVDNIFERPDIQNIIDLESRREMIQDLLADGFNSFNTRESAVVFNLSKNIEYDFGLGKKSNNVPMKIPLGINIKLLQKDLYKSTGTGIGVDVGGMVMANLGEILSLNWLDYLTIGFSANNLVATRIYWDTDYQEDVAMQLVAGLGYTQNFDKLPIRIALLLQNNFLYEELQYGAELILFDIVSVRSGYNLGDLQGGIGLKLGQKLNRYSFSVDYSFSNHELGNAHRIGGSVFF